MQYDEDDNPVGEPCPDCGSIETYRLEDFWTWKCQECFTIWLDDDCELVTNLTAEDALGEVKAAVINISGLDFEV